MAAPEEAQMPFIKNLASSDRKLRTASLTSLQTFLTARAASLTEPDALKLWKGLYYALWMTDRPLPQQALASDLAALLLSLPPPAAVPWLRAFWAVVCMQWTSIDALRLDKFLLLVRRVFAAQLRWARDHGAYRGDHARRLLDEVLRPWCFEPDGDLRAVPVGVRLHVLDLWVDELERGGVLDDDRAAGFVGEVGALVDALRSCPVKPVRARAAASYEDGRLPWGTKRDEESGEEGEEGEEDGWGGIED